MLNEIRTLGFEYAELGHGIRVSLLDGIQRAVATGEIKIASVHNFCPLPLGVMGPAPDYYLPSARDEHERELAVRHTLRSIDCAASLGAKAVVLHLGMIPMRNYTSQLLQLYTEGGEGNPKFQRLLEKAITIRTRRRQRHLEQVYRTLDAVLPKAKEVGIKLGLETRFGIEEIPDELETSDLIKRFGTEGLAYWHDVGHAQVKENLGITSHEVLLERFRGHTAGMHLQDFTPPAHDHQPPGCGTFDFQRLTRFVTDDMVMAWEIHPEWKPDQIGDACKRAHESLRTSVNT